MFILNNSLAPMYDRTATYKVDDVVIYGKKMYKCTVDITTAEEFNEEHWTRTYVTNKISAILKSLVDLSADTVTESVMLEGYTAHDANKNVITGTIPSKDEETITPGTTDITIEKGVYLSGNQTVSGDENLVSSNIKAGTTIFGVTGNSNVIDTSSANAGAADIVKGKKAGVDGSIITGTLPDKTGTAEYTATATLDSTNSELEMAIPETGKYSTSNKLKATFSTIASLIGLTSAKIVKGNTILGITGNNNNIDTSSANAGAADIVKGKKAGVDGSIITGTMTDYNGKTVTTENITMGDEYLSIPIPNTGRYNTSSVIQVPSDVVNSNLSYNYETGNFQDLYGSKTATISVENGCTYLYASVWSKSTFTGCDILEDICSTTNSGATCHVYVVKANSDTITATSHTNDPRVFLKLG